MEWFELQSNGILELVEGYVQLEQFLEEYHFRVSQSFVQHNNTIRSLEGNMYCGLTCKYAYMIHISGTEEIDNTAVYPITLLVREAMNTHCNWCTGGNCFQNCAHTVTRDIYCSCGGGYVGGGACNGLKCWMKRGEISRGRIEKWGGGGGGGIKKLIC